MSFTAEAVQSFRFLRYEFKPDTTQVLLHYAFDDTCFFCETLEFPGADLPLSPEREAQLQQVLRHLHLVAGISYYKAAIPPEIRVETGDLDAATAAFLQHLYLQGLGEFAYQNGVSLQQRIKFPCAMTATNVLENVTVAQQAKLPRRTLVPVGGGKDSLVTIEALQAAGVPITLFSVGKPRIIADVVACTGLPHICVKRQLSPQLFELNQQGAYNGHVPISAIIAYILAAAAVLYGFDTVVMSNERSANVGNLVQDGLEINHQYSKSLDFERRLAQSFQQVLPGLRYFSLLRPLSELSITRLFSRYPQYFPYFSSCNRNYAVQKPAEHAGNWCLDCPKCRFVFLALAPFLPKAQLEAIFTTNLLAHSEQIPGFAALIGWQTHKPFECVGEIEESLAAFYLLSQQLEWQTTAVVAWFMAQVLPQLTNPQQLVQTVLTPTDQHQVPDDFLPVLAELTGRISAPSIAPHLCAHC